MITIDEVARMFKELQERENHHAKTAKFYKDNKKPLEALAHEEEAKRQTLSNSDYEAIARQYLEALTHNRGEVRHILEGFLEHNNDRYNAIISAILDHHRLIKDLKKGRFYHSKDKAAAVSKEPRINTLKKSLEIAQIYNNKALETELKNMIEILNKEDKITEIMINKHTFYILYTLLTSPHFWGDNFQLNKTKATATAHQFMRWLVNEDIPSYSPSKEIIEKKFYSISQDNEMRLIYFK